MLKKTLVASGLVLAALAAQAEPVTWTLNNVRFADGGSATGWFVWDATVWNDVQQTWGVYGDFDIQTSAGDGLGWHYSSFDGNNFAFHIDMFTSNSLSWAAVGMDEPWLDMQFAAALPATGNATVALQSGWECNALYWTLCRQVVAGEVQAQSTASVPLPGSLALAGLGLLGVGAGSRRSHRR